MNLEQYLGDIVGEGRFDSPGSFGLALPQWLEKFSNFRLPDPAHGPLALVASALSGSATALDIQVAGARVDYHLSMAEPDLANPQAQPLMWALAANRASCKWIKLGCPRQGLQLEMTGDSHRIVPCRASAQSAAVHIQLQRTLNPAPESQSLPRHCGLCPTPIRLNGRPLQISLGRSYRGWQAAWSASTPELLRPGGPALLDTPLSLFLARSAAPNPLWAAVVGSISYPFLLPEAGPLAGILWSPQLRTDLSLTAIVQDEFWRQCRAQIIDLAVGAPPSVFRRIE